MVLKGTLSGNSNTRRTCVFSAMCYAAGDLNVSSGADVPPRG